MKTKLYVQSSSQPRAAKADYHVVGIVFVYCYLARINSPTDRYVSTYIYIYLYVYIYIIDIYIHIFQRLCWAFGLDAVPAHPNELTSQSALGLRSESRVLGYQKLIPASVSGD